MMQQLQSKLANSGASQLTVSAWSKPQTEDPTTIGSSLKWLGFQRRASQQLAQEGQSFLAPDS